ncbi:patatin-like phospholipase family protein [Sneathiella sp.]|jgi:patatin-like phospholipase/acyl hydrolase|uniref:patatin-like phospholipase family protein n=1 Tax=Sneathiella sp. TaxID=1964365 RepID=UPI0039E22797
MSVYKILSIDGGGIRGVIPAVLLQYLEAESGKAIADLFDLIVGTSTGGILAAGATVPDATGKPKYSATDLLKIYEDHGTEIFSRSFWKGIVSAGGMTDEQYDEEALENLLDRYFGTTTLKDCLKPVILTSYDIEARAPYFFKSRQALKTDTRNHFLKDAARATSAAPTYFEPEMVMTEPDTGLQRALIDGGVFVNNPAMCAYTEAVSEGADPSDMLLVSLGTGITTRKIPFDEAKDWGALGWVRPIISVMMDGTADATDFHLDLILGGKRKQNSQRYFRFDKHLTHALDDMDAAHSANIQALKKEGSSIIDDNKQELEKLINLLT